ncbi:MAG TPA: hypothetical protein VLB27_01790 [candidate division Zixibacteria bacterium]|nr:hypothetical protein [candidate division Zixibacteria bacterium]
MTHTLLLIALGLMALAFGLQQLPAYHELGDTLVIAGVIAALVSTPLRLLALSQMYYTQGERRVALLSLALVVILAAGAALKWLLFS